MTFGAPKQGNGEEISKILATVDALEDKQRQLLFWVYSGVTRTEIAKTLGLKGPGSTSGMIRRAKELLPDSDRETLEVLKDGGPSNYILHESLAELSADEDLILVKHFKQNQGIGRIAHDVGLQYREVVAIIIDLVDSLPIKVLDFYSSSEPMGVARSNSIYQQNQRMLSKEDKDEIADRNAKKAA